MRPVVLSLVICGCLPLGPAQAQEKRHPIAQAVWDALKNEKKPFTMVVGLKLKDGTAEKFEKAFAPAIRATLKEKGCMAYQLNRNPNSPLHYMVYERWSNLPALEAHLRSDHITTLLEQVGDLLAEAPVVQVLEPRP